MSKKYAILLVLVISLFTLTGCVQQLRYKMKKVQSDVFGLERVVTVYSIDGKPIKTIHGKFKILYPASNRMEFVKHDGKKITVSGFYSAVIEEK